MKIVKAKEQLADYQLLLAQYLKKIQNKKKRVQLYANHVCKKNKVDGKYFYQFILRN